MILKSNRLGIRAFRTIEQLAIEGRGRRYESDNPVRRVEIDKGLGRLCSVLGVGVVELPDGAVGIGRESLLALITGGLDAAAVERAFLVEWQAPRSVAFQQQLEDARRVLVPEVKLRHSLVGVFPQFRIWPKDAEYDPHGGPVQLRTVVGNFHLSGVFVKNVVDL